MSAPRIKDKIVKLTTSRQRNHLQDHSKVSFVLRGELRGILCTYRYSAVVAYCSGFRSNPGILEPPFDGRKEGVKWTFAEIEVKVVLYTY